MTKKCWKSCRTKIKNMKKISRKKLIPVPLCRSLVGSSSSADLLSFKISRTLYCSDFEPQHAIHYDQIDRQYLKKQTLYNNCNAKDQQYSIWKFTHNVVNYLGSSKSSGGGIFFSYRKLEEVFFFYELIERLSHMRW